MFVEAEAQGLKLLVPAADQGVGRILREHCEYARPQLDFMLAACPGDLMDVGANVGALCLPFAAARPHAKVVAIEGHRRLAQLLATNALNNRLYNVDVHNVVAADRASLAAIPSFPLHAPQDMGVVPYEQGNLVREPGRAQLISELAPASVALVKIDVTGLEARVLAGATKLHETARPNWLVAAPGKRPEVRESVKQLLKAAGYRLFWFFSPHAPRTVSGALSGSHLLFASDHAPPWELPEAVGEPPGDISAYRYLARYRH